MPVSRRQFFSRFGRSLFGQVHAPNPASRAVGAVATAGEPRAWLRPPGALPEADFRARCTRCRACADACPHQAIRRLGPEFGADAGTPAIIPLEVPCYLCDDVPCVRGCEPGALVLAEASAADMGLAELDRERCYLASGQPCDYCVRRCPLSGVAIRTGSDGLPLIDARACTGCGVCAYLCPGGALTIRPRVTQGVRPNVD